MGNLLLVAGASMVAGGWSRTRQTFSVRAAEANAGLLAVGVSAMLAPAVFHFAAERMADKQLAQHELGVSFSTSVILIVVYGLGLLFTLRTHAAVLSGGDGANPEGATPADHPASPSSPSSPGVARRG